MYSPSKKENCATPSKINGFCPSSGTAAPVPRGLPPQSEYPRASQ